MLNQRGVFERDKIKCRLKVRAGPVLSCTVRFNVAVVCDVSEFTTTDLAKFLTGMTPDPRPDFVEFNHYLQARASWSSSVADSLADFSSNPLPSMARLARLHASFDRPRRVSSEPFHHGSTESLQVRIWFLRHPVSISRRIVATAPADTRLPLLETSFSTCPRRVNSASVRNRSRLRLGFIGMDRHGSQSSGARSQPLARAYMWVSVATVMFAMAGVSHRLSWSSIS